MPSISAGERWGCVKGGVHLHVAVAVKVHDHDHDHDHDHVISHRHMHATRLVFSNRVAIARNRLRL